MPRPAHDRPNSEAERHYTDEEREFLRAAYEYQHERGIRFMNATDYLKVLLALGYRKAS